MRYPLGIDVSKYDAKPLDWSVADCAFMFVKCSEGIVEDRMFRQHWEAASGHTLRGAYHYFRPSIDPKKAARKLAETLSKDIGELPIALDLETTDNRGDTLERARQWCAEIQQLTGRRPIIYSGIPFLAQIGAFQKVKGVFRALWLKDCDLWFAAYPYDNMEENKRSKILTDIMTEATIAPILPRIDLCPPFRLQIWQWTSRVSPTLVKGYYVGRDGKKAVDMSFARPEWLSRFALP